MRLTNHLVAPTDENCYGPRVFALLNNQHVILGRAEGDFLHQAGSAKLFRRQLTEPRHNAPSCGDGYQL